MTQRLSCPGLAPDRGVVRRTSVSHRRDVPGVAAAEHLGEDRDHRGRDQAAQVDPVVSLMPSVSQAKNGPATLGGCQLSFFSTAFHSGVSRNGWSWGSSSVSSWAKCRSTTARVRTTLARAVAAPDPLVASAVMRHPSRTAPRPSRGARTPCRGAPARPPWGEHRPDVRVLALVVPGHLPAEVDERAVELPGVGHVPVGKLSSAAETVEVPTHGAMDQPVHRQGSVILVTLARVESTAEVLVVTGAGPVRVPRARVPSTRRPMPRAEVDARSDQSAVVVVGSSSRSASACECSPARARISQAPETSDRLSCSEGWNPRTTRAA